MDYVIGWMTLRPGHRAEFLEHLRGYVEASRAEPGVLFFELLESADSPDVVVAIEGYASAEAHEAHRKAPHRTAFKALFQTHVLDGRFETITAATAETVIVRPG